MPIEHTIELRVRYAETDQMGTYYNSRALEWFECGRTELLRHIGMSYREIESKGIFLPLAEAHVEFTGSARYDDLLRMTSVLSMPGKARFRFDVRVVQADSGGEVCRGYTVNVAVDRSGRPIRPPKWLVDLLAQR